MFYLYTCLLITVECSGVIVYTLVCLPIGLSVYLSVCVFVCLSLYICMYDYFSLSIPEYMNE